MGVTFTDDMLPPLPDGPDLVWAEWGGEAELLRPRDRYYTADQMRAYARAALAQYAVEPKGEQP